jgi:hypothetical protein
MESQSDPFVKGSYVQMSGYRRILVLIFFFVNLKNITIKESRMDEL